MNYITIVNSLRSAALTVNPTGYFHNGRIVDFSQESIVDKFPVICLYPFVTSLSADDTFDSSTMLIGLFEQDDPASSMAEREQIIQRMVNLAKAFVNAIKFQNKKFGVNAAQAEPVYQFFNGTVTGVLLRFTYLTIETCVVPGGFGEVSVDDGETEVEVTFDATPGARYYLNEDTLPDWITAPDGPFVSANKYTFIISANEESARSATLVFTSPDDPYVLSLVVNQQGA